MLLQRNIVGTGVFLLLSLLFQFAWATGNNEPQKIKLRLLWNHQFQFAGYYIAKQKGFYAASGLDVEIIEYDRNINNLQQVLSAETDFAIARSSILIDRAKGADIVALLAAYQSSPLMLLTKAFTGIKTPADLRNRRIMITNQAEKSGEIIAMLTKAGLKPGDYSNLTHSFDINDLIQGKTDAMGSYVSNEPYTLIQQGIPYNILHPADYGFRMYSDILYTRGELVRKKPKLVEAFYQASVAGWKYAFANLQETVELIYKKYNTQNHSLEALLYEGQELKKLAFDNVGSFGTLLPQRIQSMAQVYLITGLIDKEPDLQGFIYHPPVQKLDLSYDELEFIQRQQTVNICVQKDWPPYEQMSSNQYQGIIADLVFLLRDKTGLPLSFIPTDTRQQALTLTRQGICDATTIFQKSVIDHDNFLISKPLINVTHAFLSKQKKPDFSNMIRRVALPYRQLCEVCINKIFPSAQMLHVDSIKSGVEYLQNYKVDSIFASEAHLRYQLAKSNISDLYVYSEHRFEPGLSLGMNKDRSILLGILNKAINLITQKERDRILNQRVIATPETGFKQSTYWIIIVLIVLISLVFVYRYYREALHNKILKELSETDQLTGISNRRKIIADIDIFINLSSRYKNRLSLIYFDIDDFKQVNDQFGHKVGDAVLIELSRLIRNNIRKVDLFGRLGGEEFVILSPESDINDCRQLIKSLQENMRLYQFSTGQALTCSFGITEYQPGETCDSLINRADTAMYQAKNSGKNTIVCLT